jgi:hypothetical protein
MGSGELVEMMTVEEEMIEEGGVVREGRGYA